MFSPGLNNIALVENLVILIRHAVMFEVTTEIGKQQTLHAGGKMEPSPESTPHRTTVRYNGLLRVLRFFMSLRKGLKVVPSVEHTELETALAHPLRAMGHCAES